MVSSPPPSSSPRSDSRAAADLRAARRRGRTIVFVLFAIPTCAFVISSTWQLGIAAYATGNSKATGAFSSSPLDQACLAGVRKLTDAVVRARKAELQSTHMLEPITEEPAGTAFVRALSPEWDEQASIEATCTKAPAASDAFAAVRRLRTTEEALAARESEEATPVWKDVQAYLRAPSGPSAGQKSLSR